MEIRWQAYDGYAGGSRPQYTKVDDGDIEDCETVEEAMELIMELVQNDFNQKVRWSIKNEEDAKAKVEEIIANKE